MILDKVKAAIKEHNLIAKGERIVVGVSGGPDSVALLCLLHSLKTEYGLYLHVAHLDHMLRYDSHKDAEFVKELAAKLNLPVTCGQINVKELSKKGSQEEIARSVRFGFLFKVASDARAKKIALGHNMDDQAETVLMRIIRGSGLYGLAGILPKREIAGFCVIRPLVALSRREIEAYIKKKRIRPRIDRSNLQDVYFRNKVRNRLMPLLEREYNKNIKEVLANMAECTGADYDYLNKAAEKFIGQRRGRFNPDKLKRAHRAILRMALRKGIISLAGDTRRITFRHIKEIEDLILNRPVDSIVDLPKGISVIKRKKTLSFFLRK
jgi:tRNA(Ile)-lysidine synthase